MQVGIKGEEEKGRKRMKKKIRKQAGRRDRRVDRWKAGKMGGR